MYYVPSKLLLVDKSMSRFCDMTKRIECGSMARTNISALLTHGFTYSIVLGKGNHEAIGNKPRPRADQGRPKLCVAENLPYSS